MKARKALSSPRDDLPPVTMDDIARRFLATPPAHKPAKKKPRKRSK